MSSKHSTLPSIFASALIPPTLDAKVDMLLTGLFAWRMRRIVAGDDEHLKNHMLLTYAVQQHDHDPARCDLSQRRLGPTALNQMHAAVCGDQVPALLDLEDKEVL